MENQPYRPTLLDLPVSVFAHAWENQPEGVTTLRRIGLTKHYRPPIEAIRAEPDEEKQKELKKVLRAFAPVSLLLHRKANTPFDERISKQWPLLIGDVDKQDNPGIDMAELKRHITRLPYVLFCAHSVRGGLWFVVRLPDCQTPDTLKAHFRHLQTVFGGRNPDGTYYGKFGIKLDASKGSNPTELRYVSYDAAPYINENATILTGIEAAPNPKPRQRNYSPVSGPDEGILLTRLVQDAEGATEGNRSLTLNKAAFTAGGYIAAGRLDEQTAIYALETVASEWPSFTKSQKTIRSGIRAGLQKPLYAEGPPRQMVIRRTDKTPEKAPNSPANQIRDYPLHDLPDLPVIESNAARPIPGMWGTLIVSTPPEQLARPGSTCKPPEADIYRYPIRQDDLTRSYPASVDTANAAGAVSTLRMLTPDEYRQAV